MIPGPYEVSFTHPASGSISTHWRVQQVRGQQFVSYAVIVDQGGKEYRATVEATLADLPVRLVFSFAGLSVG